MSNLLSQASLVMIPSGYKEDVVYSAIPTNGNGDLSFTRASNGTRINSAGLVEVVPWNLVEQSETFDNATWIKSNANITANNTTAPNGTATADKIEANGILASSYFAVGESITNNIIGQPYTATLYAKAGTITQTLIYLGASNGIYWNLSNGQFISYYSGVQNIIAYNSEAVGDGWYKYTISLNASTTTISFESYAAKSGDIFANYTTADNFYIWGAQLNIGSTAKPYFPTTDRLNVPRLTYQNGGGGCPSLLLEKQSTNLVSYSQEFTNAYWSKLGQGVGSTSVVTANYAISPDGTQNATRFVCNLNGGTTSSDRSWMIASFTAPATSTLSIWIKLNSAGTKTFVFSDSGGGTKTISGTDWQRIDATFVGAGGEFRIGLIGGSSSDTLDCSIWGAQAESGSYPTSYIPTTSSSATRVADACFKTGISSLIGQTQGTLFVDVDLTHISLNNEYILQIQADSSNRIFLYRSAGNVIGCYLLLSGGSIYDILTPTAITGKTKIAFAYQSGSIAYYVNGTQIGTSAATFSTPPTMDRFDIDSNAGTENGYFSYSQAILFPTRLTNAELASLTTL